MFCLATVAHSFYYEKISIDIETWQWKATHNCVGRKWPLYLSIAFNVSLIFLFSDFYSKAYKGQSLSLLFSLSGSVSFNAEMIIFLILN
jgi:hypothetical protein